MSESNALPQRCCANCAVSYVIEPPKVAVGSNIVLPPNVKPQRVCRLNPPVTVQGTHQVQGRRGLLEDRPFVGLVQQATTDDTVCWHWKIVGTLPGD